MTPRAKIMVWLGKLTALDMTPLGWLGRKTSAQTNKVTMTFSTKKLLIRQCLRLEPLNLDGMLALTCRWLTATVKVTVTSSTKQAYNLAMLGARTLKHSRDVSYDPEGNGHGQGHHDL